MKGRSSGRSEVRRRWLVLLPSVVITSFKPGFHVADGEADVVFWNEDISEQFQAMDIQGSRLGSTSTYELITRKPFMSGPRLTALALCHVLLFRQKVSRR